MKRRSIAEIEIGRDALSLRGIERAYGYSREFTSERVKSGEIPATQHGRAFVVLRRDFEAWMRSRAIRPTTHAEARVAEVLEREGRSAA